MEMLLSSGKVKPNQVGQVLDLYNQQVSSICPTIKTNIDKSNMTFITTMKNEVLKQRETVYTDPNGKRYGIRIRKLTPREVFRLMGVRDTDIGKLLSKNEIGKQIISNSKLYCMAGNSIVTNCMTAMFEELIYPSGNNYKDKDGQLTLF